MSTTSGPTASDHLLATAALLWPAPAAPYLERSRSIALSSSSSPSTREFLAVPDARAPRLIVPFRARAAGARALRRYSHGLTGRERLTRTLLAAGIRTGLAGAILPDRLVVRDVPVSGSCILEHSVDLPSIDEYLSRVLRRDVVIAFGIGSPRANQKPVLNVLTPNGRSIGFVKVGDTDVARSLVRREAEALRVVGSSPLAGVEVPRLLHLGTWQGLDLLVQSALITRARRGRQAKALPIAAMGEVAAVGGRTRTQVVDAPFWLAALETPSQLRSTRDAERLRDALSTLGQRYAGQEIEIGAWHGDWTPWNMAWHGNGVQLWDWERFKVGVPVGFDLLHYQLQEWLLVGAKHKLIAATMPNEVSESLRSLDVEFPDMIVNLYFVELCSRYLLASEGSIGSPLRAGAQWLLDILSERANA